MRTTLDIADDVLAAAKAIGKEQGKSAGVVLSELARAGLRKPVRVASGTAFLCSRVGMGHTRHAGNRQRASRRGALSYLLDVNVLIALVDSAHVRHDAANDWFDREGGSAWATCPITENGLVRIPSHPKYPNGSDRSFRTCCPARRFVGIAGS